MERSRIRDEGPIKPIEACEGSDGRFSLGRARDRTRLDRRTLFRSSLSEGKPAKRRATRDPSLLPDQHERINNSVIPRNVEMIRRNVSRTIISFARTAV